MTKKKPLFNTKEKSILQTLNRSRRGLTAYDVSKKTGIAWVTTKKYINKFEKKEIVKCSRLPNSSKKVCKISYKKIYGKKD